MIRGVCRWPKYPPSKFSQTKVYAEDSTTRDKVVVTAALNGVLTDPPNLTFQ